jgi:hypothetical protein
MLFMLHWAVVNDKSWTANIIFVTINFDNPLMASNAQSERHLRSRPFPEVTRR